MPRYDFVCPGCGRTEEVVLSMHGCHERVCGCGTAMRKLSSAPAVIGTQKGDTFWSESLAINPDQAAEHRRLFPDVKIDAEGRLGFDSVKQRSDYCTATGFEKKSQRKQII